MSNKPADFKMENIIDEEWYMLVAPDGTPQLMTMAPDLPTCVGVIKLQHKFGVGESLAKLLFKGFKIIPITVTIQQNGEAVQLPEGLR